MSGFDLGAAMFKKQEYESARLDEFEFRLRARAFAALGAELAGQGRACPGLDLARLGAEAALASDEGLIGRLQAGLAPAMGAQDLALALMRAREAARAALTAEFGDPSPHRLA